MAEALKDQFGVEIPKHIAAMLQAVEPRFPSEPFVRDALHGYDPLSLTERGWHIADALHQHLPSDYEAAVEVLLASLGPKLERADGHGMAPFLYLPHVSYVARYGVDHFETSMRANYELTQRFTAEMSVRPFLERYPEAALAKLKGWTRDLSPHVRRLVSEGTRPRLPWASRLRAFQADPRPVLELLELLKDDPDLYVRRSVANNLNDIGKDHPALLVNTARAWLRGEKGRAAPDERRWLVRHALRSAIKRGDPDALALLGYGQEPHVAIRQIRIHPERPAIGEAVTFAFTLHNTGNAMQQLLVDFRVHYVKANGGTSPKVFKLRTLELAPAKTMTLKKSLSLLERSTRKHYPGVHRIELLVNGHAMPLGEVTLVRAKV